MSQNKFRKTETVPVKYPFSIAKIFPKELKGNGAFSNKPKIVYNIEAFSAVKYLCTQLGQQLVKEYEGYEYHIYAWRATAPTLLEDKMVHNIKFSTSINHAKKAVYVDVELLPDSRTPPIQKPKLVIEESEDETFDVSHLDADERKVLASLFQLLVDQELETHKQKVETVEAPSSPLLEPCRLELTDVIEDDEC